MIKLYAYLYYCIFRIFIKIQASYIKFYILQMAFIIPIKMKNLRHLSESKFYINKIRYYKAMALLKHSVDVLCELRVQVQRSKNQPPRSFDLEATCLTAKTMLCLNIVKATYQKNFAKEVKILILLDNGKPNLGSPFLKFSVLR